MTIREVIESTSLVENHAHQVGPTNDTDPGTFAGYFTEGPGSEHARHTVHYRSGLELLRERFDAETETELLARRAAVEFEGYARDVMEDADISHIVQDTGFPDGSDPAEFARYTDAGIHPVLRIENVEEDLLAAHEGFAGFEAAFERRIREALDGEHVGLKSIAAYRSGLDIGSPSRGDAARAFVEVTRDWDGRLADPTIIDYCVNLAADVAAECDAPLQFHTGFGDADAHPRYVDPTYLHEFFGRHDDTDVVLLHAGYPYHRAAGYVVSVCENVYLDLGLAVPFVAHGVEPLLREVLELAPTTKLLYSSDGCRLPEWYLLSARRFRSSLATVLEGLVDEGFVSEPYAEEAARNVMRTNALELYGIR
jgi:hypothetical protein